MYFGGFFFPYVDYSVVFNYSNTDIEIFYVDIAIYQQLQIYCRRATKRILLQRCICCCTYKYNVITFVCTNAYLFPSPLVSCVKLKVACRVQIWKKTFCQNTGKLGYSFIKNDIMFMHIFCIYKKPHYFMPI